MSVLRALGGLAPLPSASALEGAEEACYAARVQIHYGAEESDVL